MIKRCSGANITGKSEPHPPGFRGTSPVRPGREIIAFELFIVAQEGDEEAIHSFDRMEVGFER